MSLSANEIDALLTALREAAEAAPGDPENAYTANELEEMLGGRIHRKRLLAALATLWKQGKVEGVRVYRQSPTKLAKVPAYRFLA